MELYADAVGCTVVEPPPTRRCCSAPAMAAAAAAGLYPSLVRHARHAAAGPRGACPDPEARARFDRDYRIFLEMHRQRRALEAMA